MVDRKRVRIADEIQGARSADVWWFAHTKAQIEVASDGRSATLSQNGKRLKVVVQEPATAKLEVMDAAPLPTSPNPNKQADNSKIRKLAIHLREVKDLKLAVEFVPEG
jgi:hypothetical protein